jgi:OmpA-OmpF porin, OOP family
LKFGQHSVLQNGSVFFLSALRFVSIAASIRMELFRIISSWTGAQRVKPEALMTRWLCGILTGIVSLMAVPAVIAQTDVPGSKDYPGINRMPGYYISEYQDTPFDSYTFKVAKGTEWVDQTVEGHKIEFRYERPDSVPAPSQLQVIRNYQNAVRKIGGQALYESADHDQTTLRFTKDGKEVWFEISPANIPSGVFIQLIVIEKEGMKQDIVLDAQAISDGLSQTGSIAIYGILFDTGKADLKPESTAAIAEIAKLLKSKPALKLFVVGHTDLVADVATNMKLSQARAQAVVNALVGQGIAAARLIPFGNGPYSPVATNKTEEGRAKNRRVQLVEIATQ